MTLQTQLVLRALLAEPTQEMYGLELAERAGLPPGTIYPIVNRLESWGWLRSRWEDEIEPSVEKRPRRRYYLLDGASVPEIRRQLAAATARQHRRVGPRRLPHSEDGVTLA